MCCVCRLLCVDVLCVPVYSALRRVMRAGGGDTLFDGPTCVRGGLAPGKGGPRMRKKGLRGRLAGAPCGGALRVRAKTNKKAPPPPKRGEAKLAVPPLFCTGIPLMQISLRLNAARRLRLVSAHRTGGPGAPHRGAWRTAQGPGAPHRGAWRTAQGARYTAGGRHTAQGPAHRTGAGTPHRGAGTPHRGAGTPQGAWRGGRVQQSGSGGNFVGRRRRACSQPVTRVLWCTAGGTTFSVMAFGQYLQKNQKAIGVF